MIKKILILLKLARKLALSDALKIVSKIHEPPLIIKIFLGIFSISLFGKTKQNLNLSDEERLCNSIQDMGTTFIKLGQFLSTRPDIIGEKLSKQFEKLLDKLPPFSTYEAKEMVKKDLGEEIYNSIINFNKPIAAASVAQVHKAQINDDGIITITAPDQEKGNKALKWIEQITYEPEVGEVFDGKVVKIMEFGAFVQIMPGKDGLVHISELSKERVNRVEDVVKEGDMLKVKLMKVDDKGRYSLSHKATLGDQGSAPTKGTAPESHSSHSPDSKKPEAQVGKGGTGELVEGTSAVRKVNG